MSENNLSDEAIGFIKECYVKLNQSGNGVWAFADLSQSFWLPKLQSKNKQVFFNIIHDAIAYGLIGLSNLEDFADLNSDFLNFYNGFISQINKSQGYSEFLEKRVDELENRFGLVWKEQEEQFLKIISEKEIVLGTGLFLLDEEYIFDSETKDKKNKIIKDKNGQKFTLKRKRGDSFLYYSKDLSCLFLLYSVNSKVNVYRFKENHYLEYYPILKEKGDGFGFGEVRDNLLIEGDNYYALQLLQFTHKGKVDVIYIDPPYNTGKGDFKYNDAFVGSDDGSRHSKWLSFMKKRLLLAKNLLSEKGVIFISIDENEQYHLQSLCNNVFAEMKNIVNFSWISSKDTDINSDSDISLFGSNLGAIKKGYEFILVYAKNGFELVDKNEKEKFLQTRITNNGNLVSRLHLKSGLSFIGKEKNKIFKGVVGGDVEPIKILNECGMIIENGILKNDIWIEGPFRNPNVIKKIMSGEVVFDNRGQQFLNVVISGSGAPYTIKKQTKSVISNIISGFGDTADTSNYLKDIGVSFDYAKPHRLISKLLNFNPEKNLLVLDFFAGSGTTGQAVLELNKQDGGNRKYILCTNNENNICEDVTYERMKRISNPKEYGIDMEPLEHGLKYLQIKHQSKLDFEVADELGNFEAIKAINDVKFGATKVITDNKSTYLTDTYAVFKGMNNRVSKKTIFDFIQTAITNNIFNIVCLCNGNRNYEKFKDFIDDYFQENIHFNKFNYKIHHMSQDYINQMFTVISGEEVIDIENHISFKDDCEGEE